MIVVSNSVVLFSDIITVGISWTKSQLNAVKNVAGRSVDLVMRKRTGGQQFSHLAPSWLIML